MGAKLHGRVKKHMRVSLYRRTFFFFGCNLTLSTSGSGFARFFGTPRSTHGWLEFVSFHRATVFAPPLKNLRLFFCLQQLSISLTYFKNRKKNQFFFFLFFFPLCVFLPLRVHQEKKEIYMSGVEIRLRCTTVPSNFIFPWNKGSFFFFFQERERLVSFSRSVYIFYSNQIVN